MKPVNVKSNPNATNYKSQQNTTKSGVAGISGPMFKAIQTTHGLSGGNPTSDIFEPNFYGGKNTDSKTKKSGLT